VADTHCQLVAAGGWLTESNVASTSVIRRSSLAILLFRLASLVRVVFSACARGGVSNAVRRDLRSALCVEVCRTGLLAQTKLVQELRERLDAKLDGLRKLSLLPVALHPGLGDERSAAARHAPLLGRRVVAVALQLLRSACAPRRRPGGLCFCVKKTSVLACVGLYL
jgi:hypothetical protein